MIEPLATALALAGLWAHGTFHRNSPLFGRVVARLPGQARRVALTFDDGPNPEATPRILDALASAGVSATFFMLGRHVRRWPHLARRVVDEGHVAANHGFHHRRMHLAGWRRAREDLAAGSAAIADACGTVPALFRAPHGFRSPFVAAAAAELGQTTVGWTLGVWDSERPGAGAIVHRTVIGARPGSIVLLHDGDGYDPGGDRSQTAEAVPQIVTALAARDYRFVSLRPPAIVRS